MRLTFDIPGPAVPKGRPRVTSRGTFTPKRTVEYEKRVRDCAHAVRNRDFWALGWRYEVTIHIVPLAAKKPGAKPRGADVDNVAKSILDALIGVLWSDDAQVSALHVIRHLPSRHPGVRVHVEATLLNEPTGLITGWPEYQATRTPKQAPRAQRRARP